MLKEVGNQMKTAILMLILLTFITGFLYPMAVTGLAQWWFPTEANGSLIKKGDESLGSIYIGQNFTLSGYFWGRLSATAPFPYHGAASSGSNLGPSNPDLLIRVQKQILQIKFDETYPYLIPADLLTTSASGLDPEISPLGAFSQITRIAKARGLTEVQLLDLILSQIKGRTFRVLGEPRVNVLELNIALDELK